MPRLSSIPISFQILDFWFYYVSHLVLAEPSVWPLGWHYLLEPGGVISGTQPKEMTALFLNLSLGNSSAVRCRAPKSPSSILVWLLPIYLTFSHEPGLKCSWMLYTLLPLILSTTLSTFYRLGNRLQGIKFPARYRVGQLPWCAKDWGTSPGCMDFSAVNGNKLGELQ